MPNSAAKLDLMLIFVCILCVFEAVNFRKDYFRKFGNLEADITFVSVIKGMEVFYARHAPD